MMHFMKDVNIGLFILFFQFNYGGIILMLIYIYWSLQRKYNVYIVSEWLLFNSNSAIY